MKIVGEEVVKSVERYRPTTQESRNEAFGGSRAVSISGQKVRTISATLLHKEHEGCRAQETT